VPYALDAFELLGRCAGTLTGCARGAAPETRRREVPLANMMIRFP
jgi:hypothetical protein